ncbi:hypothetical protein [Pseudomonas mandelii]|uniref:hypothetical protein n=1 Tax=Pseudomonas mandelii TaxID=75612 RepID=UPI003C7377C8
MPLTDTAVRNAKLYGKNYTLKDMDGLYCLLPDWYVDLGVVSVYFSSRKALPAKTRVFVDFLLEPFQGSLSQRFRAD